jgi:sigma-E factor negative regulatory protein RseA
MEKISQLMDGELSGQECEIHVRRLTGDAELAQRWDRYHLIRDVLRSEAGTRVDLVASVRERLAAEPTVLAPRRRVAETFARFALPAAAAVASFVIGNWWAMHSQPGGDQIAKAPPMAAPGAVPAVANGQMAEYILAHQEFSPTSAMQSVYTRGSAGKDADNGQ